MILFYLQSTLDILLFAVYLSISLIIFVAYQKANIGDTQEMFPDLWILAALFFIFRGMQNGFEALIRFSVIEIEASLMQIVFKTIIIVILFLILLVIRENYRYFIQLSQIIAKVKRELYCKQGE